MLFSLLLELTRALHHPNDQSPRPSGIQAHHPCWPQGQAERGSANSWEEWGNLEGSPEDPCLSRLWVGLPKEQKGQPRGECAACTGVSAGEEAERRQWCGRCCTGGYTGVPRGWHSSVPRSGKGPRGGWVARLCPGNPRAGQLPRVKEAGKREAWAEGSPELLHSLCSHPQLHRAGWASLETIPQILADWGLGWPC